MSLQVAFLAAILALLPACGSSDDSANSGSLPEMQSDTFDFVTFETIEEMAKGSSVVLIGTVKSVDSLGLADVGEDPNPTENVAIVVTPEVQIQGNVDGEVSIAWPAFVTDGNGTRTFEMVNDGLPVPEPGDRLLLFLVEEDRAGASFFGKVSHRPVNSSGLAFVEGEVVVLEAQSSGLEESLTGKAINEVAQVASG